ncbi:hypothetical protein Syun_020273 [Stephania yunnanensis]|uniref:Uncharacterized protein n=1 Tax=Stephania yunnanensis TaxID=152371 RepID=A0AAP0IET9_9MAGN
MRRRNGVVKPEKGIDLLILYHRSFIRAAVDETQRRRCRSSLGSPLQFNFLQPCRRRILQAFQFILELCQLLHGLQFVDIHLIPPKPFFGIHRLACGMARITRIMPIEKVINGGMIRRWMMEGKWFSRRRENNNRYLHCFVNRAHMLGLVKKTLSTLGKRHLSLALVLDRLDLNLFSSHCTLRVANLQLIDVQRRARVVLK